MSQTLEGELAGTALWDLTKMFARSRKASSTVFSKIQTAAIRSAQRQFLIIAKDDYVVAAEPRLQLLDPFGINYCGSMDAREAFGIQLRFELRHRLPVQMFLFSRVQTHVVSCRFNPIDLIGAQEEHASTIADH